MEPDENVLKKAAQLMVSSVAGSSRIKQTAKDIFTKLSPGLHWLILLSKVLS